MNVVLIGAAASVALNTASSDLSIWAVYVVMVCIFVSFRVFRYLRRYYY